MLLRGGGGGAGAGARDPVVAMPAWMREAAGGEARRRPFHVALTATDAAYSRWQCRVMYYWYKRMQALPGGEAMGIPTFVIDPLPAGKDHVPRCAWPELGPAAPFCPPALLARERGKSRRER
jgi:hypothetical protein